MKQTLTIEQLKKIIGSVASKDGVPALTERLKHEVKIHPIKVSAEIHLNTPDVFKDTPAPNPKDYFCGSENPDYIADRDAWLNRKIDQDIRREGWTSPSVPSKPSTPPASSESPKPSKIGKPITLHGEINYGENGKATYTDLNGSPPPPPPQNVASKSDSGSPLDSFFNVVPVGESAIQHEGKLPMKNITFKQLRKIILEEADPDDDFTLDDIESEMDGALAKCKATQIDELPEKGEAEMVYTKNRKNDRVEYQLWIAKNAGKPRKGYSVIDRGSRLALIVQFIGDSKGEDIFVHVHVGYSNGIATSNFNSNAPRGMWYTFRYNEEDGEYLKSIINRMFGERGTRFDRCTADILQKIVHGVETLAFYQYELISMMKKSRFTEIAWRKICAMFRDIFEVPNAY